MFNQSIMRSKILFDITQTLNINKRYIVSTFHLFLFRKPSLSHDRKGTGFT